MSKEKEPGQTAVKDIETDQQQMMRLIAAATKFSDLISTGRIPPDSKLMLAKVGLKKDGEISDRTRTLLAIDPDEKIRMLEPDRLKALLQKADDGGYTPKILAMQEIETDERGWLVQRDFKLELIPVNGVLAEFRIAEKNEPPETVATMITEGVIINDWVGFREWLDSGAYKLNIAAEDKQRNISAYPIKNVIDSQAFQNYFHRLARRELPENTPFKFNLFYVERKPSEVETIMAGFVELPDGSIEELQENLHEFLTNLRKDGARINWTPRSMMIRIKDDKVAECPECGKIFRRRRKDMIYCSRKCGNRAKVRAFRERKKESKE